MCGLYCLGLIHYVENNSGTLFDLANEFINLFEDDSRKNEKILIQYLKFYKIRYK